MTALALVERIEQARGILATCHTIEQWKLGADKAAAVLEFGRRHAAASNAHADAYELVQIANRCLGDCCRELPKGKRGPKQKPAKKGEPAIFSQPENKSKGEALAELNISAQLASELEKLSQLTEEEFLSGIAGNRERIVSGKIPVSLTAKSAATGYDSDSWHTPAVYLEAARRVLGGPFDLDPCSNADAQKYVQAKKYFTREDSCLEHLWRAQRVWLNPPYSNPLCGQVTHKFVVEHQAKRSASAVVLVNNATDTEWFHELLELFTVCLTKGRIAFERDGKPVKGNDHGQAFFYAGSAPKRFKREYETFGRVLVTL